MATTRPCRCSCSTRCARSNRYYCMRSFCKETCVMLHSCRGDERISFTQHVNKRWICTGTRCDTEQRTSCAAATPPVTTRPHDGTTHTTTWLGNAANAWGTRHRVMVACEAHTRHTTHHRGRVPRCTTTPSGAVKPAGRDTTPEGTRQKSTTPQHHTTNYVARECG